MAHSSVTASCARGTGTKADIDEPAAGYFEIAQTFIAPNGNLPCRARRQRNRTLAIGSNRCLNRRHEPGRPGIGAIIH